MTKSREQRVAELLNEEDRVQYDGKDIDRIALAAEVFTHASMGMIQTLRDYCDAIEAPIDENSVDAMKEARYNLIYGWTVLQAIVSKIAWLTRFDADEAFDRAMEVAATDDQPNLTGL